MDFVGENLDHLKIAQRLAYCLDQDDFSGAAKLIAEDCIYQSSDGPRVGPSEITALYKEHSTRAHDLFDSVEYKSSIRQINDNEFEMTYIDIISKQGKTHEYSCKQIISLSNQKVTSIQHQEIPGEYEKIKIFYRELGI